MTQVPSPVDDVGADGAQASPPTHVAQLPLRQWGLVNCPAIPYWADANGDPDLAHVGATLASLARRTMQANPGWAGLTEPYTIGGQSGTAYRFLYGNPPAGSDPLPTLLGLDDPRQFTLPWTTDQGVFADSQDLIEPLAASLTDPATAEASFWPTIANFGLPYNLLVLAKVNQARGVELIAEFGTAWAEEINTAVAAGQLYEIDLSIFASLAPTLAGGAVRFTPGTHTMLRQDPVSKALTPIGVKLSTAYGRGQIYRSGDKAWLYALQAAKASVTVYGIWFGHVYQWHIVTAALQMTMYNELPAQHRLWPLLSRHSQSLIDFDFVLLSLLWDKIVPPTPVDGGMALLRLLDRFAVGRAFFDDDPLTALASRGLDVKDFTVTRPWDAYPVVGFLLDLWTATSEYVTAIVKDAYGSDSAVAGDLGLKAWMDASRDPARGNIRGLPPIDTRAALSGLLTSIVHRVTAHGVGNLNPSVNPVLSFMATFPPCLQSTEIPQPSDAVSQAQLLAMLPHTGALGSMTTFYFTLAYGMPDVSLIPAGGINAPPYFPGPTTNAANQAWFQFRGRVHAFIDTYVTAWDAALARIRGSDPGVPSYATELYQHWASSVET
ncbi:MAG TPA: hypothetical protein VMF14_01785 [Solirubrobacteraceae bacterium]|nr:hypothetical protein [Solirubrobacteraceae bacterium]